MTQMPTRAQVVIIGGGIVGASVAYHLTELGLTDLVLLEQGQLSCGTTWHAAGLVGQLRASESGTRLVQYSADLYQRLEAETGLATGYKQCGGVTVARTEVRMTQLLRTAAAADAFNLECEILTPAAAKDRYPILETSDLVGAIWLPLDGTANPTDVTQSLAKGARMRGAQIFERVRVIGVSTRDGVVTGVQTDQGDIEAQIVVNCGGQWAKAIGAMCGVNVPLHSSEHFYVVTEQIEGVHRMLPILRDPDGYTYMKEEVGGLVVGGFEPVAKPWVAPDQIPYPFEFQLLDEDWDHFEILMESALNRVPVLKETGIKKFYNGPESFTPDNQFILGEAPEVKNFFVAAGFNSVGIASAGGAGRALAQWIVGGEPASDLVGVDIRRFAQFNGNNQWLKARVGEVLGLHYAVPWPNREFQTARPFRRSPVHHLVEAAGASFGSKMGWELYVPSDFAVGVFDLLTKRGQDYGIRNAGYYAINSLRLEKGYRAFGVELTPDYTPVEAGLLFATKLKTDIPFLGRDAVETVKTAGPKRRLVSFTLDDPSVMMWGGELLLRAGVAGGSGQVTSAAWGTTLGRCVGLAYIWDRAGGVITPDFITGASWQVNVGGQLVGATVSLHSPYDPNSQRIRT